MKEAVEKLGGTITQLSVSYNRKIWGDSNGSIGGDFGVTIDLHVGADPDESFDALYEWVKAAATRNLKPSFEAAKSTEPVRIDTVADGLPTVVEGDAPGLLPAETNEPIAVAKFKLSKRTDGKFLLEMYPKLSSGRAGDFVELKYIADREHMWSMLEHVLLDENLKDLPVEYECSWWADWKHGNEYTVSRGPNKGEVRRYQDLVRLRVR